MLITTWLNKVHLAPFEKVGSWQEQLAGKKRVVQQAHHRQIGKLKNKNLKRYLVLIYH
jgi:hypothetical protein